MIAHPLLVWAVAIAHLSCSEVVTVSIFVVVWPDKYLILAYPRGRPLLRYVYCLLLYGILVFWPYTFLTTCLF